MTERLLTLNEACKRLGIHPNTLRKWDRQGKIRVIRTVVTEWVVEGVKQLVVN